MAEDNPFAKFSGHPSANPFAAYRPVGDPDPTYQYKGPKAGADLQNTQSEIADRAAARRDEHTRLQIELHGKGLTVDATGKVVPMAQGQNQAPLTPAMQARVTQLIDGRSILTAREKGMPYGQQLMDAANAQDPMFDEAASKARWAARQQFTGEGKGAQVVGSAERLAQHANDLYSASAALDGPNLAFTPLSNLAARVGQSTQGPAVTRYNGILPLIAGELQKLTKNGSATKDESDRIMANLASGQSSAARTAAIQDVIKLAEAQKQPLHDQWESAWSGTTAPKMPMDFSDDMLALNANIMNGGKPLETDSNGHIVGGLPGAPGSGPNVPRVGGSGSGPTPPVGPNSGGGPMTLATGSTKAVDTSQVNAVLDGMIRSGASDAQISAAIQPLGFGAVDPRQTARARAFLAKNPNYSGSFGSAQASAPTTAFERFKSNPIVQGAATAALGAGDAALFGTSDEIGGAAKSLFTGRPMGEEIASLNADKQAAFANNPGSALFGQTAGAIAGMAATGGGLAAMGGRLALPRLASSILGDVTYGAASGAGQDNDNRLFGTIAGGVGGLTGNLLGQGVGKVVGAAARTAPGLAVTNSAASMASRFAPRMFGGRLPVAAVAPLTSAERSTVGLIDKAGGLPSITGQLTEANNLGVPMSLADTHPEFRELAGAAVRRSPTASSYAENNLIPRSQGQYDRFTSAVDKNFGPTINIPQRSADLTAQARTAAGPLYDQAYASPVVSTPQLESTLNTPFGQQALGRARTIAANERRSPSELGFAQDANGNTVLNPQPGGAMANHLAARQELDAAQDAYRQARATPGVSMDVATMRVNKARQGMRDAQAALDGSPNPSLPLNTPGYTTQTLDYVKRGMDDVLEQQRNPFTGRLNLDEAGRAQNAVKNDFLNEIDRINPAYADARNAYAGPASARGNMAAGQDAYTANPQQLGVDVAGASPERLGQMQLGYQGSLVDHASRVRDSGNPWEATLGSPMARDRVTTMFPDNPGVADFLRQRELENGMQQTTTAILGNSRTARNLSADQAFDGSPFVDGAVHAGLALATHGASLPVTASRMAGSGLGDWWKVGRGASAVAKADDLAPILMNPDPTANMSSLGDILARKQAYSDFVARTTPQRPLGMFGASLGSQGALAPFTYGGGQ